MIWFSNFNNIAFLVAIGVLVLYCDDVATEVALSRSRRSRRGVMVVIRAWLGQRNFRSRQKIVVP